MLMGSARHDQLIAYALVVPLVVKMGVAFSQHTPQQHPLPDRNYLDRHSSRTARPQRSAYYALLQTLFVARLLPWIMQQPFAPSYWAFSFGLAALATAALRMTSGGDGPIAALAPWLFIGVNLAIGLIALGTLLRIAQRRLLSTDSTIASTASNMIIPSKCQSMRDDPAKPGVDLVAP
jgi:hypothetical protein